jgi:hypothetical protein
MVNRPSMKSVGAAGSGKRAPAQLVGRDRGAAEVVVEAWLRERRERSVHGGGRIRYSQLRRFAWRGAVNAVPD